MSAHYQHARNKVPVFSPHVACRGDSGAHEGGVGRGGSTLCFAQGSQRATPATALDTFKGDMVLYLGKDLAT